MTTKIKGIVIAGNYWQYLEWCKNNFYNTFDYLYISDPIDLLKFKTIPIYYVGQYWDNLAWKSQNLIRIEYENARRQNMKSNWKEIIIFLISLAMIFGISLFGILKTVTILEKLTTTYFIGY